MSFSGLACRFRVQVLHVVFGTGALADAGAYGQGFRRHHRLQGISGEDGMGLGFSGEDGMCQNSRV
jgi:hypothetical protein